MNPSVSLRPVFTMGRCFAFGLLAAFLIRIVCLNYSPISAISGHSPKPGAAVSLTSLQNTVPHFSDQPGKELAIAELKEAEESVEEQLLKHTKYPLLLFSLLFLVGFLPAGRALSAWSASLSSALSRRIYLAVSVLRI
jgi:hypothetical protein